MMYLSSIPTFDVPDPASEDINKLSVPEEKCLFEGKRRAQFSTYDSKADPDRRTPVGSMTIAPNWEVDHQYLSHEDRKIQTGLGHDHFLKNETNQILDQFKPKVASRRTVIAPSARAPAKPIFVPRPPPARQAAVMPSPYTDEKPLPPEPLFHRTTAEEIDIMPPRKPFVSQLKTKVTERFSHSIQPKSPAVISSPTIGDDTAYRSSRDLSLSTEAPTVHHGVGLPPSFLPPQLGQIPVHQAGPASAPISRSERRNQLPERVSTIEAPTPPHAAVSPPSLLPPDVFKEPTSDRPRSINPSSFSTKNLLSSLGTRSDPFRSKSSSSFVSTKTKPRSRTPEPQPAFRMLPSDTRNSPSRPPVFNSPYRPMKPEPIGRGARSLPSSLALRRPVSHPALLSPMRSGVLKTHPPVPQMHVQNAWSAGPPQIRPKPSPPPSFRNPRKPETSRRRFSPRPPEPRAPEHPNTKYAVKAQISNAMNVARTGQRPGRIRVDYLAQRLAPSETKQKYSSNDFINPYETNQNITPESYTVSVAARYRITPPPHRRSTDANPMGFSQSVARSPPPPSYLTL